MADTPASKAGAERRVSSNLTLVTMDSDDQEFLDKALVKDIFAYKFLKVLAQEISCEIDPVLIPLSADIPISNTISANVWFIGKARKCWVGYVDSACVHLYFPKWDKTEIVQLNDPKSLERLEIIFHDETFDYASLHT